MKPLCYAPFIGLYVSTRSGYAPCCVSKKFESSGPEEFWTSETMKSIREQLLNGKFPESCSLCRYKIESGVASDVTHWANEYNASPSVINVETGNYTDGPTHLDYRPSNQCNLKCRMCGSAASSSIEREVQSNPELAKWYGQPRQEKDLSSAMNSYVQTLELEKVKILGGEPSIDPVVWDFIESLSKLDNKPTLRITTNGTTLNKHFKDVINKFENLEVTFSVDAINETYNYIRTNANWYKTSDQIENFMNERTDAKFGFNVVMSPWNVFSLNELLDWFAEIKFKGHKFKVNFDDSDDAVTGLSAVLPEHIEQVIKTLDMKLVSYVEGADNLVKILKAAKFDKEAHESFKKFSNALDRIRRTHSTKVDYRMMEYI